MPLLKLHGVGKPGDGIADCTIEAQQYGLVARVVFVAEDTHAILPDLHFEANEPMLRAGDNTAFRLGIEKNIGGVEVAQTHPPASRWQSDAGTVVEVEADAAWPFLGED